MNIYVQTFVLRMNFTTDKYKDFENHGPGCVYASHCLRKIT